MPLNPQAPPTHPLLFLPQWPNCIYAASWTEKKRERERGNFNMLRRFSPRQISKLNCLDLKKQKDDKKKTSDIFALFCCLLVFFFCFSFFFATENLSQTCLYEAERRECVRQVPTGSPAERNRRGCTLLACVRVRAWVRVLACSWANLGKHIPWDKALSACSLGKCTKKKRSVDPAKEKNLKKSRHTHRFFLNTWMKELSVSVCGCCSIQRCPKQQRRPSQASADGSGCQESSCYVCYSSDRQPPQTPGSSVRNKKKQNAEATHKHL